MADITLEEFVAYFNSFYDPKHPDVLYPIADFKYTEADIYHAIANLTFASSMEFTGDSVDRERVREELQKIKNPKVKWSTLIP
jgi:hypothetical protein